MSGDLLEVLVDWFERRRPELGAMGVCSSLTRGPHDRNPASVWVDFEAAEKSARLIVWSDGQADLMIGNFETQEVLLQEHREITSQVGLDDAELSVLAWLT